MAGHAGREVGGGERRETLEMGSTRDGAVIPRRSKGETSIFNFSHKKLPNHLKEGFLLIHWECLENLTCYEIMKR